MSSGIPPSGPAPAQVTPATTQPRLLPYDHPAATNPAATSPLRLLRHDYEPRGHTE
jgi:hypothetical protein